MKFGVGIPTSREGGRHPSPFAGPKEIVQITQMCERLGFDSIWGSDFTNPSPSMHIPQNEPPPRWYDVLISLSYLAALTERIQLGIGVIVLPYREPVILAKQLAALDCFSNGRLLFGVGLGGWRDEFDSIMGKKKKAHRGRMLVEQLELLTLLLTQDDVNFQGEYFEVSNVSLNPKPVQKPFPIYISGNSPDTASRVARWGTGQSINLAQGNIRQKVDALSAALEERGRNLSEIDVLVHAHMSLASSHEKAVELYRKSRVGAGVKDENIDRFVSRSFIGTTQEVAERIHQLLLEVKEVTHITAQNIAANTVEELEEQVQIFNEEIVSAIR